MVAEVQSRKEYRNVRSWRTQASPRHTRDLSALECLEVGRARLTLTFLLLQLKHPFLDLRCGLLASLETLEEEILSGPAGCGVVDLRILPSSIVCNYNIEKATRL